jgi:hypothetical protein
MGLFDFFKTGMGQKDINLSDFKYISNDHIRYQNGKDVSGHNYNCWRGIRVQNNISGGQGYTVTVYNLDGNHSVWGSNIQMAPKQMKIIEQNRAIIKLKGYGSDQMGASFADYGLTLELDNGTIRQVALHMHDRNIDIVYIKAENEKTQQNQSTSSKKKIPEPSTNVYEIMALSEVIHEASQDPSMLKHIFNQKGNYNHPQICYDFGVAFLIQGDKAMAKKALLNGAIYGIQYPSSLYENAFSDSVGQCLSLLMIQFPIRNDELGIKITALGYIFLSRCIELFPRESHDSYRTRGLLFKDHETPMVVSGFVIDNVGMSTLVDPFIISDLYFASQATNSPHRDSLQSAKRIHNELGDISIGGKDASDYSLSALAELGEKRHLLLFKSLEQKYKKGQFDITVEELQNAII